MRRRYGEKPGCPCPQDLDRDSGRWRNAGAFFPTRRGGKPRVRSWHSWISSARGDPTTSSEKNVPSNSVTLGNREPGWTLRRRLQALITFALLPVVLVSIFQG